MAVKNLHEFLVDYFEANQCEVKATPNTLDINLTEEMDEKLMNRPFYWHYVRQLNQVGEPLQLKLTTDYSKATKERNYIYFSTERFKKIVQDTYEKGRFVKLYQKLNPSKKTPLYPWLIVNIQLSYLGKSQHQEIRSFGIQLINGTIIDQAFDWLDQKEWDVNIQSLCYQMSPIIRPNNGFERIEHYLLSELQNAEHKWAHDSYQALTEELELLNYFKDNSQNMNNNHYQTEKENLESIYQPNIKIKVINGGLFYIA